MRKVVLLLIGALLLTAVPLVVAGAPPIKLIVDGREIHMEDAAPVNINGRIYLPTRYVAEALGAQVEWDAAGQRVIVKRPEPPAPAPPPAPQVIMHEGKPYMQKTALIQMLQSLGLTPHITPADVLMANGVSVHLGRPLEIQGTEYYSLEAIVKAAFTPVPSPAPETPTTPEQTAPSPPQKSQHQQPIVFDTVKVIHLITKK